MGESDQKPYWEGKHYAFFTNTACECFPCHKMREGEPFNCLFCYCPLYALGRSCGGNFTFTANGVKDCSNCLLPHRKESYGYITAKFQEIVKAISALEGQAEAAGKEEEAP